MGEIVDGHVFVVVSNWTAPATEFVEVVFLFGARAKASFINAKLDNKKTTWSDSRFFMEVP